MLKDIEILAVNRTMAHFQSGNFYGTTQESLDKTREVSGKIVELLNGAKARWENEIKMDARHFATQIANQDNPATDAKHGGGAWHTLEAVRHEALNFEGYIFTEEAYFRGSPMCVSTKLLISGNSSFIITLVECEGEEVHTISGVRYTNQDQALSEFIRRILPVIASFLIPHHGGTKLHVSQWYGRLRDSQ